jgi:multiple sugar transport system permease protein
MNAVAAQVTPLDLAPPAGRQKWGERFAGVGFAAPASPS